jgi:hypothetical protein
MKYLFLVLYLFSSVSFASHCNKAHDDDDHKTNSSEMEESANETSETDEEENSTDSNEDSDSEV